MLRVISSSPGQLELIFQAMLENATRLCQASFGNMLLYEGRLLRRVAFHNTHQSTKSTMRSSRSWIRRRCIPLVSLCGPSDRSMWSIWLSQNLTRRFITLAGPAPFLLYQCSRATF